MRGSVAFAIVACAALAGCARDEGRAEADARHRDAALLREVMLRDPALPLLADVRRVVEDDLPVRASELVDQAVLPAAVRQVEAVAALALATPDGRALRERLDRVYVARLAALRAYQRALARGPVEDLDLLDAVRGLREAEEELASIHAAVAALAGEAGPEGSASEAR